ncbi:MAG: ydfH 1 [Planctomycetaceae bacterium]|nr:ydfH 1 [Planctomycetaceae bacterium]
METPIRNLSLREQIVEHLRNDVLCGRLVEGERLNEAELAKRFGVSRTPIREALQQLTTEGLLDGQRHVGVKVAHRPLDSIRELVVPIRRSLETFALRLFFDSITEQDFTRWNLILEKMRLACLADDFPTIAEQDIAFHRSIVRRAGQRDLEAMWSAIVTRIRHHFFETQKRLYLQPISIYDEHARILDVFRQGNVEAAVEVLAQNIG